MVSFKQKQKKITQRCKYDQCPHKTNTTVVIILSYFVYSVTLASILAALACLDVYFIIQLACTGVWINRRINNTDIGGYCASNQAREVELGLFGECNGSEHNSTSCMGTLKIFTMGGAFCIKVVPLDRVDRQSIMSTIVCVYIS